MYAFRQTSQHNMWLQLAAVRRKILLPSHSETKNCILCTHHYMPVTRPVFVLLVLELIQWIGWFYLLFSYRYDRLHSHQLLY